MASRAYNGYMRITKPDIKGECTEHKHKDWIEIRSYHFDVGFPSDEFVLGKRGGVMLGEAHVGDFMIRKLVDASSATIQSMCCRGKRMESVEIEISRPTGDQEVFYRWVFGDAFIRAYQHDWGGGLAAEDDEDAHLLPTEQIAFGFSRVKWEYRMFDHATGAPAGTVVHEYDVASKKAT